MTRGAAPAAALRADRLYRFFHTGGEETLALRGVSLSVAAGELVAVTGPSGSGKSTLLHCLAGLDEPDGGSVHLGDERLSRRPEPERAALRARGIGVLFQSDNLLGHLSVADNVAVAQRLAGRDDPAGRAELLDRLGLASRARARAVELSGGEAQRAALAVALANDPSVLLADEPTGEVDATTGRRIVDLLRDHTAAGAAVLVVTHSDAVADAADRRLALHDGELAA
ncbi:MAG TPA: ABC transporter ATP-binding protein [Acidimicrobiales bacterium]|nr:ABC transporter ATP-binding protein [Acidimicrobiales bacterium]